MSPRFRLRLILIVALIVASVGHPVFADMSRKVTAAFRGELVISTGELPEGRDDKDTIAQVKKARLKELKGQSRDDVTRWTFHYTAFLEKTGARSLTMKFTGGDRTADKRLTGVDPKATVLTGDITIDEDEGLKRGRTYTIELLDPRGGVVATTRLTMK